MKKIFIWLIVFYRKYLSPLKSTKCPYYPSCSQYGLEAVQRYGAFRGGLLAAWRILRCNPFSTGGFDPVPVAESVNYGFRNKKRMYPITRFYVSGKKPKNETLAKPGKMRYDSGGKEWI